MPNRISLTLRELSVIQLLQDGPAHGYVLTSRLSGTLGWKSPVTQSSVYSCLKRLERCGRVVSSSKKNPDGPKRRVYKLALTPYQEIPMQSDVIRQTERKIDELLEVYTRYRRILDQVRRYARASAHS